MSKHFEPWTEHQLIVTVPNPSLPYMLLNKSQLARSRNINNILLVLHRRVTATSYVHHHYIVLVLGT
jgi:hypothetical protein